MKRPGDRARTILLVLFTAAGWLFPSDVRSVEFAVVGPRAMGMGGTGVAVTTDALATYWNPAGLAMQKSVDIRVQASAQITDRLGMADTLNEIDNIDTSNTSPANIAMLQGLLNKLNGASVSAAGAAGLYLKSSFGNHAFGFNISDVATGGQFTPTPLTASVTGSTLTVNGELAIRGLEARQVGFSYAYALANKTLSFGTTLKIIQGAAYAGSARVSQSEGDLGFTSDLGQPTISTAMGIDAGVILRPFSWLRIGVVGKDLNQPTFDAPGGQEFKLIPQIRGGVGVNPYSSLTLTFEGDLTSNPTLLPGVKSRLLGLGAEQTLFAEALSLRVGALKNVEDAQSKVVPTAGLGIAIGVFRLDLGGGYDFSESQALASGSLALTF